MSDWVPLREHLHQHVVAEIAAEPDPGMRAALSFNLDRILDVMEVAILRKIVAEREAGRGARARA